ncbi:MAG: hypothetical protein ACJAYU_000229, partial [Bradymonadia bacterium]
MTAEAVLIDQRADLPVVGGTVGRGSVWPLSTPPSGVTVGVGVSVPQAASRARATALRKTRFIGLEWAKERADSYQKGVGDAISVGLVRLFCAERRVLDRWSAATTLDGDPGPPSTV